MLFTGDKEYSPLICVGRNVRVKNVLFPSICLSPSGRIAVVMDDPFASNAPVSSLLARVQDFTNRLRKFTCDDIDGIAADYFYDTTGQAARGIDIMARNGYVTLAANEHFFNLVDEGLREKPILFVISVASEMLELRKMEFSSGSLGESSFLFSLVPSEIGAKLLP